MKKLDIYEQVSELLFSPECLEKIKNVDFFIQYFSKEQTSCNLCPSEDLQRERDRIKEQTCALLLERYGNVQAEHIVESAYQTVQAHLYQKSSNKVWGERIHLARLLLGQYLESAHQVYTSELDYKMSFLLEASEILKGFKTLDEIEQKKWKKALFEDHIFPYKTETEFLERTCQQQEIFGTAKIPETLEHQKVNYYYAQLNIGTKKMREQWLTNTTLEGIYENIEEVESVLDYLGPYLTEEERPIWQSIQKYLPEFQEKTTKYWIKNRKRKSVPEKPLLKFLSL